MTARPKRSAAPTAGRRRKPHACCRRASSVDARPRTTCQTRRLATDFGERAGSRTAEVRLARHPVERACTASPSPRRRGPRNTPRRHGLVQSTPPALSRPTAREPWRAAVSRRRRPGVGPRGPDPRAGPHLARPRCPQDQGIVDHIDRYGGHSAGHGKFVDSVSALGRGRPGATRSPGRTGETSRGRAR